MEGLLYVMWNEDLRPGVIKIGRTNDLRQHVRDLYSAGVPAPFRLAYRALVDNYEEIEKQVHESLKEHRLNTERDFFECPVAKAIFVIREAAHIISEEVYFKDEEEIEREQDKRKQKRILEDHNEKQKKTREQYIETEGIWLDKPSFYVTIFLGLVAFILFPEMDEYFKDNSAIKWFLAAIPPFIYWHFASKSYAHDYHELSKKANRLYPTARSYDDIPSSDLEPVESDQDSVDQQKSTETKKLSSYHTKSSNGASVSADGLRDDGLGLIEGVSAPVYEEDGSVTQASEAKISWVCHFCATDNLSYPARELVCVRCNKASSFAGMT